MTCTSNALVEPPSPHIYQFPVKHIPLLKEKKEIEIASCFLYNCFDSLRCLSIMDISHLKDRVNNYIHFLNGSFISNEAASSQRESLWSRFLKI